MKLEKIAREAGKILLENFEKTESSMVLKKKQGIDFSIQTDKMVEDRIVELLKEGGFDGEIVTEEAGNLKLGNSKSKIFVDPLDGTWNFSRGIPYFCTALCLQDGDVMESAVYDPNRDEMFTAKKGQGAYLNGKKIKVNENTSVTIVNMSYLDDLTKILEFHTKNNFLIRSLFSSELDLCYTAMGRTDASVVPKAAKIGPWDIAAGCLMVEEAGGIVTDKGGKPWTPYSKGIIAGNKSMHKTLLELVGE